MFGDIESSSCFKEVPEIKIVFHHRRAFISIMQINSKFSS